VQGGAAGFRDRAARRASGASAPRPGQRRASCPLVRWPDATPYPAE